jgi:hypothetical protein
MDGLVDMCQDTGNSCEGNGGQTITMYHGTSGDNAASIETNGFRPSTDGMLGKGVYLSRNVMKARSYGAVVLTCSVRVGRVKIIDTQGHPLQKTWHEAGYDTAWVPPACGMVSSLMEEDCVYDPSRIAVLGKAGSIPVVIEPWSAPSGGAGTIRKKTRAR